MSSGADNIVSNIMSEAQAVVDAKKAFHNKTEQLHLP